MERIAPLLLLVLSACGLTPPPAEPLVPVPAAPAAEEPAGVACRPADHALERGPVPFAVGDTLVGWTVDEVQADHIEFVRVFFDKGGTATGIEVRYQEGDPDEWSTELYRLMPAPALQPPEELLKATMGLLRAHQGEPFVRAVTEAEGEWAGLPPCEEG